jgi:hypothetical protein
MIKMVKENIADEELDSEEEERDAYYIVDHHFHLVSFNLHICCIIYGISLYRERKSF